MNNRLPPSEPPDDMRGFFDRYLADLRGKLDATDEERVCFAIAWLQETRLMIHNSLIESIQRTNKLRDEGDPAAETSHHFTRLFAYLLGIHVVAGRTFSEESGAGPLDIPETVTDAPLFKGFEALAGALMYPPDEAILHLQDSHDGVVRVATVHDVLRVLRNFRDRHEHPNAKWN